LDLVQKSTFPTAFSDLLCCQLCGNPKSIVQRCDRELQERSLGGIQMLESTVLERTILPSFQQRKESQRGAASESLRSQLRLISEAASSLLDQIESVGEEQEAHTGGAAASLKVEVRRLEVRLIRNALSQTSGHQRKAARLLGVKATTLNAKIKRYKIPVLRGTAGIESGVRLQNEAEG
jgi:DNA-binding NtrC family response regulator